MLTIFFFSETRPCYDIAYAISCAVVWICKLIGDSFQHSYQQSKQRCCISWVSFKEVGFVFLEWGEEITDPCLNSAAESDEFTGRLMQIWRKVYVHAQPKQKAELGLHRSDYMLHVSKGITFSFSVQVHFN